MWIGVSGGGHDNRSISHGKTYHSRCWLGANTPWRVSPTPFCHSFASESWSVCVFLVSLPGFLSSDRWEINFSWMHLRKGASSALLRCKSPEIKGNACLVWVVLLRRNEFKDCFTVMNWNYYFLNFPFVDKGRGRFEGQIHRIGALRSRLDGFTGDDRDLMDFEEGDGPSCRQPGSED